MCRYNSHAIFPYTREKMEAYFANCTPNPPRPSCSPSFTPGKPPHRQPTTALDVTVQAQILELIKTMQRDLGMAVIFITHDLGVVSGLCDRVMVMYAGRVVESADVRTLFYHPRHPYTRGLQRSIPALQPKGEPLYTIPGLPPDVSKPVAGCAFAPRCEFATTLCTSRPPELLAVAPAHAHACLRAQAGELTF